MTSFQLVLRKAADGAQSQSVRSARQRLGVRRPSAALETDAHLKSARGLAQSKTLTRGLALLLALVNSFCVAAEPPFDLTGFASIEAHGLKTTTGGGDAKPVMVRTAKEFQSACERLDIKSKAQRDNTPRVIVVAADIDLGELANQKGGSVLTNVGVVRVRPNTTIYALGAGATIRHGTIEIHGAWNIIIRNLRFRDLWEFDPTGKYDKLGWDYVRITNAGQTHSHHIWVDHCDFEKAYDGLCDVVHGSDLVTISWCRFAGDARGPHKKCILIGHSSGPSNGARDGGRLNVTLHHNWFENIEDRAPRARFGNIHCYNNVIETAKYATISVSGAVTLVENCVYSNALVATSFSHAKDKLTKNLGGTICIVDSRNLNPATGGEGKTADEKFERANNFKSSVERAALKFNAPADFKWEDLSKLPYRYDTGPVDEVAATVRNFSGTGKIVLPEPK